MSDDADIVISGLGVVSPLGIGIEAFWTNLRHGVSGIVAMPDVDPDQVDRSFGGIVRDFDGRNHVQPRKALKVMCRELQMGYAVGVMATEHAGLVKGAVPTHRIGTVFGSEMLLGPPEDSIDSFLSVMKLANGAPLTAQTLVRGWGVAFQEHMFPLWMLKYLPNMAACHVGIAVDAQGPNNTILLGDTSGLAAIIEAANVIRRGSADVMIAGAVGTHVNPTRLVLCGRTPRAAQRVDLSTISRPYAVDRDGYVGSEGAAAIVLESAEHLQRRGGRALATLRGTANRFIAPIQGTRDCTRSITAALRSLIEQAKIPTENVAFIDAHAMGDPVMDLAEARAIQQTLPDTPVTAGKSLFGHQGAACGTVELVAGILGVLNGIIPPTRNADSLDPQCQIRLVGEPQSTSAKTLIKLSHTPQGQTIAMAVDILRVTR